MGVSSSRRRARMRRMLTGVVEVTTHTIDTDDGSHTGPGHSRQNRITRSHEDLNTFRVRRRRDRFRGGIKGRRRMSYH